MPIYETESLYDWSQVRANRYFYLFLAVGIPIPSIAFLYVYAERFLIPLLATHSLPMGFGWASVDVLAILIGFAIVLNVVGLIPEPATRLKLDDEGVAFSNRWGREWRQGWDDRDFFMKFLTMTTPRSGSPRGEIRMWFKPENRMPLEAADALMSMARQRGLSVVVGSKIDLPDGKQKVTIRRTAS